MKILMFGWEFPLHISGGLGTACQGLTKGLSSFDDIELKFVVPQVFGDENNPDISPYVTPDQFEKIISKQKRGLTKTKEDVKSIKLGFTGQYNNSLFEEVSKYGIIASQIARLESHDIIHSHDWLTYIAGIEAKKVSGKPLVVHVHATEYDRCGENHNKQVFEVEREGMALADKVITVSNYTRNIVIDKYRINPSNVVTVHNAVEPISQENIKNRASKGFGEHIVTFLGRITGQKGPEYFVQAAYKVLQKIENVRFVMAGAGDLLENMVKYVAELKIADKFYFTCFLKGDDVYKLYAMSDLYIMPSISEPFGISTLEAIQSNVPVIISKQSGVSEVISHAIKVDFWDTDAIADAIYGILNYPSLARHLKTYSIKELENLRWTNVAAKVKEIYYQVSYNRAS